MSVTQYKERGKEGCCYSPQTRRNEGRKKLRDHFEKNKMQMHSFFLPTTAFTGRRGKKKENVTCCDDGRFTPPSSALLHSCLCKHLLLGLNAGLQTNTLRSPANGKATGERLLKARKRGRCYTWTFLKSEQVKHH